MVQYSLFYSPFCYYCQKVMSAIQSKEQSKTDVEAQGKGTQSQIALLDTNNRQHMVALLNGGGKTQVPCLRIEPQDGPVQWLYESDDIIAYLTKQRVI